MTDAAISPTLDHFLPHTEVPPSPQAFAAPAAQTSANPSESGSAAANAATGTPDARTLRRSPALWLAGAGPEELEGCHEGEQRKIGAIGYTVLVPTLFALLAASYAVSTLTSNPAVITAVALLWAAIILFVDRAIIATHSPFMKTGSKSLVLCLRLGIAVLMGLTVSHPLTLLLFRDTITARIEADRDQEIETLRQSFAVEKQAIENRIAGVQAEIDKQHRLREESYEAKFLRPADAAAAPALSGLTPEEQAQLARRQEEATLTLRQEAAELATRIQETEARKATVQAELDDWQKQFEAEVNGQRSGFAGVGPRARSIQKDQIDWRRADVLRLSEELRTLGTRRTELETAIAAAADGVRRDVEQVAADRADAIRKEQERVAGLQRQAQTEQMAGFLKQQEAVRAQIQAAIDSSLAEKETLGAELAAVSADEKERIEALRTAPRRDLLTQTLALHHLFEDPAKGGHFALIAYLVLAGLFLAVDTMPILVKFTTQAGEYDHVRKRLVDSQAEGRMIAGIAASRTTREQREDLQKARFTAYQESLTPTPEKIHGAPPSSPPNPAP
jgi:hypothetical protein